MKYEVVYSKQAKSDLKKMDKNTAKLVLAWIEKHLIGCNNPRSIGKGLSANRSGQWRYRVGDYRILAEIIDNDIIIYIIGVGHRKNIYK